MTRLKPGIVKYADSSALGGPKVNFNLGIARIVRTGEKFIVMTAVGGTQKEMLLVPIGEAEEYIQVVAIDLMGLVKILVRTIYRTITSSRTKN